MDDRDVNWEDLYGIDEEIAELAKALKVLAERQNALKAQLAIKQGQVALRREDYDGVAAAFKRFMGADDASV